MEPELKPCPFCGENDNLSVQYCEGTIVHPAYRVYCDNCGASTGYVDKANHVDNWNRRAPADPAKVPSDEEVLKIAIDSGLASSDSIGDVVCGWREDADISEYLVENARALLAKYSELPAPQPQQISDEWKQAIDHELVSFGSTADSYSSPKEAINALIKWNLSVATDPKVNGGYMLVPIEPTQKMLFACEDAGTISNHRRGKRIYKAMLKAAPEPKKSP